MTDAPADRQAGRYDRIADGYARWWGPVIGPWSVRVLDLVAANVAAGARDLIDVGTGTGTVAFAALRRWPDVRVVAIDPSAGMLDVARARAMDGLTASQRRRLELVEAFGDRLPFDDGRFDLAVSAFVLQLVPSRARVLREVHRALRGGGRLAHVTWLAGERRFAGDSIVDAVLDDAGFDPPEPDRRPGDLRSVNAARAGLRAAGFRQATATSEELAHAFTAETYTSFVTEFDEADTFASMSRRERRRSIAGLRSDLLAVPADDLVLRLPVVFATGVRD